MFLAVPWHHCVCIMSPARFTTFLLIYKISFFPQTNTLNMNIMETKSVSYTQLMQEQLVSSVPLSVLVLGI